MESNLHSRVAPPRINVRADVDSGVRALRA
jgi:hypothetical protein